MIATPVEGFDPFGHVSHQIRDFTTTKHQHDHDTDNNPVPNADTTHSCSPLIFARCRIRMDNVWTLKAPRDKDKDFLNRGLFLQTKQAQKRKLHLQIKKTTTKIVIFQTNERMGYGLK
jgi:hypothetical protein